MKTLLILSLFVFSTYVCAKGNLCIIISGVEKDHNNAFAGQFFYKEEKPAGKFTCKIFNSWKEADEFIKASKLNNGDDLLIIQGAHGSPGGGASCNADSITGEEIHSYLKQYQAKYQVGAILDSCYSGDVLKLKLKEDELESHSKLEYLCLITSSDFNTVAYGDFGVRKLFEEEGKNVKGKSLQQIYGANSRSLISSAAWSSIGVPQFLNNKDIKQANNLLLNLNNFEKQINLTCDSDSQTKKADYLSLCSNKNVSSDFLELMTNYEQAKINIKNLLDKIEVSPFGIEPTEKNLVIQNCINQIGNIIRYPLGDMYGGYLTVEEYLFEMLASVEKVGGDDCSAYKEFMHKEMKQQAKKLGMKPMQGVPGIGGGAGVNGAAIGPSKGVLGKMKPAPMKLIIDPIINGYFISVLAAIKEYDKLTSDLVKELNNTVPIHDITPENVINALSEGKTCRSEDDIVVMMSHLLGESVFSPYEEYESNPRYQNDYNLSSYKVMMNFKTLSNRAKKFTNKKDLKRRKACENFTF